MGQALFKEFSNCHAFDAVFRVVIKRSFLSLIQLARNETYFVGKKKQRKSPWKTLTSCSMLLSSSHTIPVS